MEQQIYWSFGSERDPFSDNPQIRAEVVKNGGYSFYRNQSGDDDGQHYYATYPEFEKAILRIVRASLAKSFNQEAKDDPESNMGARAVASPTKDPSTFKPADRLTFFFDVPGAWKKLAYTHPTMTEVDEAARRIYDMSFKGVAVIKSESCRWILKGNHSTSPVIPFDKLNAFGSVEFEVINPGSEIITWEGITIPPGCSVKHEVVKP